MHNGESDRRARKSQTPIFKRQRNFNNEESEPRRRFEISRSIVITLASGIWDCDFYSRHIPRICRVNTIPESLNAKTVCEQAKLSQTNLTADHADGAEDDPFLFLSAKSASSAVEMV
jgi:hypothetical protein